MTRSVLMMMAAALAGCAASPDVRYVTVPCAVTLPERPAMPTEALEPGCGLDDFVAAAAAEIERREGYEKALRAALGACQDAPTEAMQAQK